MEAAAVTLYYLRRISHIFQDARNSAARHRTADDRAIETAAENRTNESTVTTSSEQGSVAENTANEERTTTQSTAAENSATQRLAGFEACNDAVACASCGNITSQSLAMNCSGIIPHCFCSECFRNYARNAFEFDSGAFFRQQKGSDSMSAIGELPCPIFAEGHCNCSSLDRQTLARVFTEDLWDLWHGALGRIAIVKADEEQHRATSALQYSNYPSTAVGIVREAIEEALSEGGSVACPRCHTQVEKDDACMHTTCQTCRCYWCYWCGRIRGSGHGCSTCDDDSMFLDSQPGFQFATVGNEGSGESAQHEFYRRRMGYFVGQIKATVPANLWDQLIHEHPLLLTDVPTTGRQIEWSALDSLSQPPVFGRTKARQLAWIDCAQPIIERLQLGLNNLEGMASAAVRIPQAHTQTEPQGEANLAENELRLIEEILREGGPESMGLVRQILGQVPATDGRGDRNDTAVCSICGDDTLQTMPCSGNNPHHFCSECFCNYARTAFENGSGIYYREHTENNSTSSIGELPCPLFSGGYCSCSSLDQQALAHFFSEELLGLWHEALGRVAVARAEEEQCRVMEAFQDANNRRTAVDLIRGTVEEALSEGGSVSCPKCHTQGEKDDACMHITCESCGCKWCYCCGRVRGIARGCSTCDRNSISLQDEPGFHFTTIGQESSGYSALHEFHRRRMGYFVGQIKSRISANLWHQLRREYPSLLSDTPTTGRQIEWDEIDDFRQPPVFGYTNARQLAWIDNAEPIIERLQQGLTSLDGAANAATAPQTQVCDASSNEVTTEETNILIEEILRQGGSESRNLVSQIRREGAGSSRRFFRIRRRRGRRAGAAS